MHEPRLLVLDDDPNISELVCQLGLKAGYKTRSMRNHKEIPDIYDSFRPDIVVLDILMPGMDGFEVLQLLYQRNSQTKIVILSGQREYRKMAERMAAGLELNIAATIAKPFNISDFYQILEELKLSLFTKSVAIAEIVASKKSINN